MKKEALASPCPPHDVTAGPHGAPAEFPRGGARGQPFGPAAKPLLSALTSLACYCHARPHTVTDMATSAYKTCDLCRKRKVSSLSCGEKRALTGVQIKCVPAYMADPALSLDNWEQLHDVPCANCRRLNVQCVFGHVYGRPGRPSG